MSSSTFSDSIVFVAEGSRPNIPFHNVFRGSLSAHPIATCWIPNILNGLLLSLGSSLGDVVETNDLRERPYCTRLLDDRTTLHIDRDVNIEVVQRYQAGSVVDPNIRFRQVDLFYICLQLEVNQNMGCSSIQDWRLFDINHINSRSFSRKKDVESQRFCARSSTFESISQNYEPPRWKS